jgi:hypothetical protein
LGGEVMKEGKGPRCRASRRSVYPHPGTPTLARCGVGRRFGGGVPGGGVPWCVETRRRHGRKLDFDFRR